MENYPSNSNKVQTEGTAAATKTKVEKEIKRVTVADVSRRKKPLGKRFAETFGGGDAQSVMLYIVQDVLMPAAKDAVIDAVSQGIEKMLLGETRGRSRSTSRSGGSSNYTSYNRYANGGNPNNRRDREDPRREISQRGRATHDFDEIVLDSRAEADAVLDQLITIIDDYEFVTVADLYEMVGITGSFTDDKWGWANLQGSHVTRIKNGYLLDLPRPIPADG